MSITCKFTLSRSSNIYYSGDEIAGSLAICSLKHSQIEAIIIEFYGQSTVQWSESDKTEENIMHNDFSTHEVSEKTYYSRQQKHACEQLKLDSATHNELLPHVEYTLRYCFAIPQHAPATYSCMYGQTEYGLRLQVQRTKKANKEFHHKIIIKNKLDLTQGITYKKSCAIYHHNEFGHIHLQIPCSGFAPGQKIPYYLQYQATQADCKVIIQFNYYTTCRTQKNCNKSKQLKQTINYKKHLLRENSAHINIPLHCHISSVNDPELIISKEYSLQALLVNGNKKVLLSASIPLTIGTSPCYIFDTGLDSDMCYNNLGFSSNEFSSCESQPKSFDLKHSGFYPLNVKNI